MQQYFFLAPTLRYFICKMSFLQTAQIKKYFSVTISKIGKVHITFLGIITIIPILKKRKCMNPKDKTASDHVNRLNRALDYIYSNLENQMSLDEISTIACFSPFHFHRIFSAYFGESLNNYIRRLRLERSAKRLCYTKIPISDLAFSAGYETPSSFTKAFKQQFSESPSAFRKNKIIEIIKTQKIQFKNNEEKIDMKSEIRNRPETKVIYSRQTGKYETAASKAWQEVCSYAFPRQLVAQNAEFIGVSHDNPDFTKEDKLRYDACISITANLKAEGEIGLQVLAGGNYKVFLHKGPYENLLQTYQQIYGTWFEKTNYKLRNLPCFELYLNHPDKTPKEELLTEIHIPVE